jgi:flagellin
MTNNDWEVKLVADGRWLVAASGTLQECRKEVAHKAVAASSETQLKIVVHGNRLSEGTAFSKFYSLYFPNEQSCRFSNDTLELSTSEVGGTGRFFKTAYILNGGNVMSLRINHNTASLNAHRNLEKANERVSKSLERLSSGLRINSAGDGAAALMSSEQLRSQVASIDQAIRNSESTVSMVQTAEGALAEANNTLVAMRQLAVQSANEGSNDAVMLAANQTSIRNMIASIDRIAEFTQFGQKKLLDGSNGVSGLAIGDGLQFVSAMTETQSSGEEGYDVMVTDLATRAKLLGTTPLTEQIVSDGERLVVTEGGKTAQYVTKQSDSVDSAILNFAAAAQRAGLNVTISKTDNNSIQIEHNMYGNENTFSAASSTAGVLSEKGGIFQAALKGKDLRGTINGEAAIGKGETMTGISGNKKTDGLSVRYHPTDQVQAQGVPAGGLNVGKVSVTQNALTFQIGPGQGQTARIALQNVSSGTLARGVENRSGFKSLSDVDVMTSQGAQDSMTLIDKAINDVIKIRAELGAFQKNTLETNVANMQIAKENMVAAESNIRDTDMAAEMAEYTKNDLIMQSSAAMLAQANQIPQKVLRLLE